MSKVHRRTTVARLAQDANRMHKHPCRSAPQAPANVSLNFKRRLHHHQHEWTGMVKWDAVTQDVASRPLSPELYEIELQAIDASGDPVETRLQAVDLHTPAKDWAQQAGTVPTNGRAREFNAASDQARLTPLAGWTAGIEHSLEFYARKQTAPTDIRVTCAITDTTTSTVVATKNAPAADSLVHSHVIAHLSFVPVAGHTYRADVTYFSGSTGVLLFDGTMQHDKGDAAVWRARTSSDASPLRAHFPLAHPDSWFYQARVRVLNRVHGGRCWSAWTAWTTPALPTDEDAMIGPPDVTGLTMTFRKDAPTNNPWRARVVWNEVPHYLPPNGESHQGAASYDVVLETSATNGGSLMHTRRATIVADPTGTTNEHSFNNVKRSRWYRVKIRPVDAEGNAGAFTSFTNWAQPGGNPADPLNITTHNPEPRVIVIRWDPPTDETDVDRYHWKVVRGGGVGTLVDEGYVGKGTHKVEWHIPAAEYAAHKHATYRGRVKAEEAPYDTVLDSVGTDGWTTPGASSEIESTDVTDAVTLDPTVVPAVSSDGNPPASSPAATVVVASAARTLFISWPEVANADQLTYDLYRHTVSGFTPPGTGTLVFSSKATAFLDTNIAAGTLYYYRVIARDADGSAAPGTQGSGTPLSYGSDRVAPASSPAATVTIPNVKGTAVVTWTAISNADTVSYQVWRHTVTGFTPPGTGTLVGTVDGTQLTDTSLVGGTTYYYRIIAVDVDGSAAPGTQGSGTPKAYASDGAAPSSSPPVTVRGGVGYLYMEWDAITNVDPVSYDVHLSTTSGFTPSGATLSATVDGTFTFARALPDGTALAYYQSDGITPQKYYCKIVARDQDGSAAAGTQGFDSMKQAVGGDIAVGAITAKHILAGSISTQYLGAVDSVISKLVAGSPTGQHVEIDSAGLRVIGSTGATLVNLPTDPKLRPTFNGDLIAQNLQVIGATFLGATTIAKGTDVTLQSAVQPPSGAPNAQISFPAPAAVFNEGSGAVHRSWFNLAYLATGGATGTVPCFYVSRPPTEAGEYWRNIDEYRASDGLLLRTVQLPNPNDDDCWGVTAFGGNLYVLHKRWSTGGYFLKKYDIATLTQQASQAITSDVTSDKPGLGNDGTSLFVVCGASTASPSNMRTIQYNTSLVSAANVTHTALTFDTRESGGDKTTEWSGLVKVGSTWYLACYSYDGANIVRRGVYAFTGTITTANGLTRNTDEDFFGAEGTEVDGLTHDGTQFYSILDGGELTKHTNWTWTSVDSPVYWVGYTWNDSVGTAHETTISPRANITAQKRAALLISTNPLLPGSGGVDDPNGRRVYINRGAAEPQASGRFDGRLQTTVTTDTALLTSFATGGAQNPATNNFGTSTAARIVDSSATGMVMGAGGTLVEPSFARLARPTSPVLGQVMVDSTSGMPFAWDGVGWVPLSAVGRTLAANWQIDADDFMAGAATAGFAGPFTPAITGTGAGISSVASIASHQGIWVCDTGTTATGRTSVVTGLGSIITGAGRMRLGCFLRTPGNLSDATNRYRIYFGLIDGLADSTTVDGIWLRYTDNLAAGTFWGGFALNDSVAATSVIGAVAVAVATWYYLEIDINDAGTQADFYVNKTLIGSITSGLPSGTGDEMRIVAGIEKVVGTSSRTVQLDEMYAYGEHTTAR